MSNNLQWTKLNLQNTLSEFHLIVYNDKYTCTGHLTKDLVNYYFSKIKTAVWQFFCTLKDARNSIRVNRVSAQLKFNMYQNIWLCQKRLKTWFACLVRTRVRLLLLPLPDCIHIILFASEPRFVCVIKPAAVYPVAQ